ncbi:MAG: hypothetical protein AAFZ01_07720 [Pseudomonadota bacterium]
MSDGAAMLRPVSLSTAKIAAYADASYVVVRVYPGSPAEELGVRQGWRLLRVDGIKPNDFSIENARRGAQFPLLFADDTLNHAVQLEASSWPFGLVLAAWPGSSHRRRVMIGDFDPETMIKFWATGLVEPLAAFEAPLRYYLGARDGGVFSRFRTPRDPLEQIASHPDFIAQTLLALATLAGGAPERAMQVLEIARATRKNAEQDSFSMIDLALDHFVASHALTAVGDTKGAWAEAQRSKELAPEIEETERWLAHLEGREPHFPAPDWIGQQFPVAYNLDASDPAKEIVTPIDRVGFDEIVSTLNPGEFLLIMVLGTYRSNTYYNLDMERVAELKRAFPDRLREVHVITHGTYALSEEHRRQAEGVCQALNLPFVILWDEGAKVSEATVRLSTPARFLVDHTGTIRATEPLMEEEGFWAAISRSTPDDQVVSPSSETI